MNCRLFIRSKTQAKKFLSSLSIVLIALWFAWWGYCVYKHTWAIPSITWLPMPTELGIDFYPNYHCLKSGFEVEKLYSSYSGGDPRFQCPGYMYPRPALLSFVWTLLPMNSYIALSLWLVMGIAIIVAAALMAFKTRPTLRLRPGSLPVAMLFVLFCSPILFELERANSNRIILFYLMIAVSYMRRHTIFSDFVVGSLVALAFWTKIYPVLLFPALFCLRRWRALGIAIGLALIYPLLDFNAVNGFLNNAQRVNRHIVLSDLPSYLSFAHGLLPWGKILTRGMSPGMQLFLGIQIPPSILALIILWVGFSVFRLEPKEQERIAFPFLLWVTGTGTFFSPLAFDYSLIFFPLTALAVWSRRDGLIAWFLLGVSLIFLQPFAHPFPVNGLIFNVSKFACLLGLGISLRNRCMELSTSKTTIYRYLSSLFGKVCRPSIFITSRPSRSH